MNYLFYLWGILGIVSIALLGKYSRGIYMYSAIGAFAAAITAVYNTPVEFQALTAAHAGIFALLVTETGYDNLMWIIVIISEILFIGIYFL